MEMNPNHGVIRETQEQWQKISALLIFKLNAGKEVVITLDDINAFANMFGGEMPCICIAPKGEIIRLFIVAEGEGNEIARREGGLPV